MKLRGNFPDHSHESVCQIKEIPPQAHPEVTSPSVSHKGGSVLANFITQCTPFVSTFPVTNDSLS